MKGIFRFLFLFCFCSVLLIPFGLQAKVSLVATTTDIKYIAEQIAGDRAEIYGMIRGVDDPHFIMTRPDFLVRLNQADILCVVGLDFEVGWVPFLQQQSATQQKVKC